MTLAEDVFQRLGKSKYYFKIELRKGCWQIPFVEEEVEKTALISLDGTYDFFENALWNEKFGGNAGLRNKEDFGWNEQR